MVFSNGYFYVTVLKVRQTRPHSFGLQRSLEIGVPLKIIYTLMRVWAAWLLQ